MERHIGLAKAILWEEAKGKLRALVAASGQGNTEDTGRPDNWQAVEAEVHQFIQTFENAGLHE